MGAPRYQLLVKNQFSQNDLYDNLHPDWELDCQKNYVFYKVEDPSKRIRGLWFHDDSERQRIEQNIEETLKAVRDPVGVQASGNQDQGLKQSEEQERSAHPQAQSQQGDIRITKTSVQNALRALANDDNFVDMVMQKLAIAAKDQS